MHESVEGGEFVKTETPLPEIPFVRFTPPEPVVVSVSGAGGSREEEECGIDEQEREVTLQDKGWLPLAVTDECLKPSEDEWMICVGYQKDGTGGKKEYAQEMRSFSKKALEEFIKKYSLEVIKETKFNKKFTSWDS